MSDVIDTILTLPGLRGFWPMSSVGNAGAAIDISGQQRSLAKSGFCLYGSDNKMPYVHFNGIDEYLTRIDDPGLDILGNEPYISSPGLTIGGFFRFSNFSDTSQTALVGKYGGGVGQRSYLIGVNTPSGRSPVFSVSQDGTNIVSVQHITQLYPTIWYFIAARFVPSQEMALFVDGDKVINTAPGKGISASSVPSSIYNSPSPFQIGAAFSSMLFSGSAALCFVCVSALSDDDILRVLDTSFALL